MMNCLPIRKAANAPVLPAVKLAALPVLPSFKSAYKAFCLGTVNVNGKETKITASIHADTRMDERQVARFETIMAACSTMNLAKYAPADEVMVQVPNAGLSFVLGFNFVRMGMIQLETVIDKPYAAPSPKHPKTILERVAV